MHYPEKKQLRQFLQARGISYNAKRKTWRCPLHDDQHESATLYENADGDILYCPVCGTSLGIFDLCGKMDGLTEFKDMLNAVRNTLNISDTPLPSPKKNKKPTPAPIPFPGSKKAEFEAVIKSQIEKKGEIKKIWKYKTSTGDTIAADVRYEREGEKKEIITFWYDGKRLAWTNTPVFIYGLDCLTDDRPVLIHEGAKCADAGPGAFINMSWSGGSGKAHLADWSVLQGREVFILPDDDEPGRKAALAIKKQLTHAKIIKNIPEARTIKPKSADIVEILQVMTADEFTAYVLNPENILSDTEDTSSSETFSPDDSQRTPPRTTGDDVSPLPFKVLGIGDDGRAAFITEAGRLVQYSLESLGKEKMRVLANHWFWHNSYSFGAEMTKKSWEIAIDDLIRLSERLDFDESQIRGRGAWRDGDKISYHDGVKTYGEYDDKKIYLKLPKINMGIGGKCADGETVTEIKNIMMSLSFETPADAVRCMGWSALAPFCGALKYRPSILLTGESGTGKSKVQELFMVPLSGCIWADMRTTSTAGIRSRIGKDNTAIIFDEAGKETEKMKMNFEDILAFVRSNYSSNSPDAFKGKKDGGYVNYKLNSIFGIASTDPTIENVQDENRILRVNFVKPKDTSAEWKRKEADLTRLITADNCNRIRAYTWARLKTIIELTDRIVDVSRTITNRDHRASYADMLLASAYMVVWNCVDNPTDEQIKNMLDKYYQYQPQEEQRDESQEYIDRLLDEIVEIIHTHKREKITIREGLSRIYDFESKSKFGLSSHTDEEVKAYQGTLGRYGVRLFGDGVIAIVNQHHMIRKILNLSQGYQKIFARNKNCIKTSWAVSMPDGKPRKCSIIDNMIPKIEQAQPLVETDKQVDINFE